MSLIQHTETLPVSAETLFDLTQDYTRRSDWDPFPESYEFHDRASHAKVVVHLTVHALKRITRALLMTFTSGCLGLTH